MSLNIIVCIKSVVLEAPEGRVVRTMENSVLNPFDLPAIEMAIRLRDEQGGTVTAVTMGPEVAVQALYEALAMGVDRAVLLSDRGFAGADTLATSKTLAAAIKKTGSFDLIIFGARTSDSDTGQVGPQTALNLDMPIVTGVCEITSHDKRGMVVRRKTDEFMEEYEMSFPVAVSIHPGAIQPRDPSLGMIEKVFEDADIERIDMKALGLAEDESGEKGSPTKVVSMSRIKRKRKCEFITGSVEEQADELVRRLKEAGQIG